MRWRRFLPANASGGIVGAGTFTLAPYSAGAAVQRMSGTITWVLGVAAAAAIIAVWFLVHRQADR